MSRSVLALLTGLLAAGTAHAQDMRSVSGEAFFRERMALPENAELQVEVTGFQNAVLGESSAVAGGRQVPWPFEVTIPAGVSATLKAAISIDDATRWVSEPVAIASGTDDVNLGELLLTGYMPIAFQSAFMCGDTHLNVGFQGEEAIMETDDQTYHLKPAISADGAKYQSEDGLNIFWSKGDNALVTLDGRELPECNMIPAKAHPAWSAQGNEPGWRAVIADGRIALDLNYGEDRLDLRLPAPEIIDGRYRYSLAQFGMEFGVADTLCRDDMSGRLYPQTVTLDTATGALKGCGGNTASLLSGAEWTAGAIGGKTLDDAQARPSLAFSDDGQISGSTSCNRFFGSFSIDGEGGFKIDPLATTQMACSENLMKQEQTFLKALGTVNGFDIADDGALLLTADGDAVIKASR